MHVLGGWSEVAFAQGPAGALFEERQVFDNPKTEIKPFVRPNPILRKHSPPQQVKYPFYYPLFGALPFLAPFGSGASSQAYHVATGLQVA